MIGRMRPFYQAHWDISNDIKHVWLLFCTYYIAWVFQWILGDEEQYRVWTTRCVEGGRWWDRQEIVPVDFRRAFCPLEGGGGGGGPDILAPGLQWWPILGICALHLPIQVHTHSSGQPFLLRHPGSSWGFSALLKGTSTWYWRWRERCTFTYIHSPHL